MFKTRAVFERYNIVSERDLRDAARKLSSFLDESRKANSDLPTQDLGANPGQTTHQGRKRKGHTERAFH